MVSKPLPSLSWGSVHMPMRVASRHSLGHQEREDPMRVAAGTLGLMRGVIVTSHIAWEWRCAYMYKHTLLDTIHLTVMAMNLSELRS